ncbi:MAG: LysR family transcriptional regulator [Rhizomicrobium sp.]
MPKNTLRNLDLNLMVVFEAIYAMGSSSAAAKHLNMSQPAVSNALARLRTAMDDPLFKRLPRGLEPTQKARRMIGPVREALKLLGGQVREDEIDFSTYERHFKIIIADPLEAVMIPGVLNRIDAKMPRVTLECISTFRTQFVEELQDGTVDLACTSFPPPTAQLVSEPIAPNDIVLVARRGHPAFGKPLTPDTYAGLKHIMLIGDLRARVEVEQSLRAKGVQRKAKHVVSKLWSFPPMIAETDLVGTLPRYFARHVQRYFDIEIHESPVPFAQNSTYMTWHVRNNEDPAHRWLREALMEAFRDTTAEKKRPRAMRT